MKSRGWRWDPLLLLLFSHPKCGFAIDKLCLRTFRLAKLGWFGQLYFFVEITSWWLQRLEVRLEDYLGICFGKFLGCLRPWSFIFIWALLNHLLTVWTGSILFLRPQCTSEILLWTCFVYAWWSDSTWKVNLRTLLIRLQWTDLKTMIDIDHVSLDRFVGTITWACLTLVLGDGFSFAML